MTFGEYQEQAQRTSNNTMLSAKIENGCLGLAGESGECCDDLKKYLFQEHGFDTYHMALELGDVLWYVVETAIGLGYTLEQIAQMNIEKLMRRYPNGFESKRSVNRDEE